MVILEQFLAHVLFLTWFLVDMSDCIVREFESIKITLIIMKLIFSNLLLISARK